MSFGAEIEKPIYNSDGDLAPINPDDFLRLRGILEDNGIPTGIHYSDIRSDHILGVTSAKYGEQGVDNGSLIQETATPVSQSLVDLRGILEEDLVLINTVLAGNRFVADLSLSPTSGPVEWEFYRTHVAPKGVYAGTLWPRGWDHTVGFRGQAQNSPGTGVEIRNAADAVSLMFAVSAANLAIFGNSPEFDSQGNLITNVTRPKMWDRMFADSTAPGDRNLYIFPDKPFGNLAEYFKWMWGEGTNIFFLLAEGTNGEYKSIGTRARFVKGTPSVLTFLGSDSWEVFAPSDAYDTDSFPWAQQPEPIREWSGKFSTVKPTLAGVQHLQFMNFGPARVRFALDESSPIDPKEFAARCINGGDIESLIEPYLNNLYIEGRDPCANFPSTYHWTVGEEVARSVLIGPSALQAGLLQTPGSNLSCILQHWGWKELADLRQRAMQQGLKDPEVAKLAQFTVEMAGEGLQSLIGGDEAERMLKYPNLVISTGNNGSSRAEQFVLARTGKMRLRNALIALVNNRTAIPI